MLKTTTIVSALLALVAAGCGGSQKKATTQQVSVTGAGPAKQQKKASADADLVASADGKLPRGDGDFSPIYFLYDEAVLSEDARAQLQRVADYLAKNPTATVLLSGHADERGTPEYNIALGNERARAARDYLKRLGVAEKRMRTVSYGEERPAADGTDESAWSKNRRVEFEISP